MSHCLVCKSLDPRNEDAGGKYYEGDLGPFLHATSSTDDAHCQSCDLIRHGLLRFFSLSELEKYMNEKEAYHHQLWIGIGSQSLEVDITVWAMANPTLGGDEARYVKTIVQKRIEFYVLPGNTRPIRNFQIHQLSFPFWASELPWKAIRTRPHQQEPIQTSVRKYLPVWLNECFSTHDLLYHTLREPLPKRVIDIGQSSGNSALRLYETKGESERYICLSHCWGDFQPICTTTANINDYKKSISWKSLPKTFQDTVDLARFLNVRYLWIDSLCIIQDDLKDWEREAAEMANIYSKSYLTIAATAAFDCSQGLYSNSTQQITGPHELKVIIDGDKEASVYAVSLPPHDAYEILAAFLDVGPNFPLLKRAWCFQEHILSPRVIQPGPYEAVFECNAGLKCPCGQVRPNGSPKSGLAKFLQQYQGTRPMDPGELQSVHSAWYDTIVREYAARLLKYSSDRLVALSGVARVFHSAYQSTYLAGLWERDLLSGLCWYLRPSGGELKRRPNEYIAPTWSWASINQPVQWSTYVEFGRFDAEIVQALCTPKTHDPFGAVRDGRITVKGTLVQVEHSTPSSGGEHSVAVNGVNKVYHADYPPEGNLQPLASKQTYFLLRLSHAERLKVGVPKNIEPNLRALVLKASGSNYERVGYLEAYGQEVLDWFEGVTEKVITIV